MHGRMKPRVGRLLNDARFSFAPSGGEDVLRQGLLMLAMYAVYDVSRALVVADDGVGISDDDQQRVFERFYRVDKARSRATGGTGLGLSIVQQTAERHGGSVSVVSRPGLGSTFTVRIPTDG